MRSPGINGDGELMGQPANPGSPGKMAVKTECGKCSREMLFLCFATEIILRHVFKMSVFGTYACF